jgi:hypothetical protein
MGHRDRTCLSTLAKKCVCVCVPPRAPPGYPPWVFGVCSGGYGLPAPGRPPFPMGGLLSRMEAPALLLGTGPERADWLFAWDGSST